METLLSICLGIGLAASVGFRVFLPLFVLSLASYLQYVNLNESWQWIGGTTALVILGVATLVELLAYYIPIVDNFLDTVAIPLATLAGTLVMVSTVTDLSPVVTWTLAIIAGGGTATAIKSTASTTRLTSTVSTAGIGNPIVATIETVSSVVIAIVAVILPLVAFILVLGLGYYLFKLYKKFRRPNV
ncbi:MAG: DUF4126 domain-containing protein [Bacteroidia bacterium]|nr:DUF4126 domain-containing protein [Bacteroidia bacterium]NNL83991.1 DUF4126 domain-containing protein [Winogradskyella sp.]